MADSEKSSIPGDQAKFDPGDQASFDPGDQANFDPGDQVNFERIQMPEGSTE